MVVSEDFIKEVYSGGDIPFKGPLKGPLFLPPRPQNRMKPITSLSNIDSKIKKMRCNVCQSQSSIDKVMGRNQKVCDMCETVPVDPSKGIDSRELKPKPANNAPTQIWIDYLKSKGKTNDDPQIKALQRQKNAALIYYPGSTNLKFPPRPSGEKPDGLGNNPLGRINTNLLGKNTESAGKNTESAFNTPGSLNLEAMANARAAAAAQEANELKRLLKKVNEEADASINKKIAERGSNNPNIKATYYNNITRKRMTENQKTQLNNTER
jgi:hypothetical protein